MTTSIRWCVAVTVPTVIGLSALACAGQGEDALEHPAFEDAAPAPSTLEAGASTASDASDASGIELCSEAGWCPIERPHPKASYLTAAATKSGLYAVFSTGLTTRLRAWTSDHGWTAMSKPMGLADIPLFVYLTSATAMDDEAVLIAGRSFRPGPDGNLVVAGYYGSPPPSDPTQEWTLAEFSLNCGWPTMPIFSFPALANIGGEVYLAACAGLYRFDRAAFLDGAADYFEPVYVDENASAASARAVAFSVAGTASDDLWLAAYRTLGATSCLTLVHIGPDGATTIADSDPTATGCVANGRGMVAPVLWNPAFFETKGITPTRGVYVMAAVPPEPNRLMRWTLGTGMDDVKIDYSTAANAWSDAITGVWQGKDRLWAVAGNFILQVQNPWSSSDAFQLSTQARNGFVDGERLHIVTGTPDALWLLGDNGVALRRQEN